MLSFISLKRLPKAEGSGDPVYEETAEFSFDNYKFKITRDGITEYYNPSYSVNNGVSDYSRTIMVVHNGETYYVPCVNKDNGSKLPLYEEQCYPSNGWYSDINQDGEVYELLSTAYTRNIANGWYFSFGVENVNNTVPKELLVDALNRVNSAFGSAYIHIEADSVNTITLADYDDTWLGLCSSRSSYVNIKLNNRTMNDFYGAYTSDTTSTAYKKWLGTTIHEFGHTFGNDDQATHYPSLYDYSRNRDKALYLQANDIAWLKHAYCDLRGCSEDIFNMETSKDALSISTFNMRNIEQGGEEELLFDYPTFDTITNMEERATNIVTAKLTFDRTENLNIGSDELPLFMDYNIYTIDVIDEENGTLTNKELKISVHQKNVSIVDGEDYKLYLQEYDNSPCSLINVRNGIVKID